jgi:hypothetical protein
MILYNKLHGKMGILYITRIISFSYRDYTLSIHIYAMLVTPLLIFFHVPAMALPIPQNHYSHGFATTIAYSDFLCVITHFSMWLTLRELP